MDSFDVRRDMRAVKKRREDSNASLVEACMEGAGYYGGHASLFHRRVNAMLIPVLSYSRFFGGFYPVLFQKSPIDV